MKKIIATLVTVVAMLIILSLNAFAIDVGDLIPESDFLCIKCIDNRSTVKFYYSSGTLEYRYDRGIWTEYKSGQSIVVDSYHRLYFKGTDITTDAAHHFEVLDGKIALEGSLASLNVNERGQFQGLKDKQFDSLFSGATLLVDVDELDLDLPLARGCFRRMFEETGITSLPRDFLPTTKLEENCYEHMFLECNELKNTPYLPATELADFCYYGMFRRCKNLSKAEAAFTAWGDSENRATTYFLPSEINGDSFEFNCPAPLVVSENDAIPEKLYPKIAVEDNVAGSMTTNAGVTVAVAGIIAAAGIAASVYCLKKKEA